MPANANVTAKCPIRTTLDLLGGKWRLLILHQIGREQVRYSLIKQRIPEISEKMLSQELKTLVESGLVVRLKEGEAPLWVDYRLTEIGLQALTLADSIAAFGEAYHQAVLK